VSFKAAFEAFQCKEMFYFERQKVVPYSKCEQRSGAEPSPPQSARRWLKP